MTAIILLLLMKVREGKEHLSPERTATLLALMGTEKATKLFYSTVPEGMKVQIKAPSFVFERRGRRVLVYVAYKFTELSREDIAAAHRFAEKEGINEIIVLSSRRKRIVLQLTAILPERFEFPSITKAHNYLKSRNALPEMPHIEKRNKLKAWSMEELVSVIFAPEKLKYYLFTAIILMLSAFLFDFYLYMAILPLTFAVATALRRAKQS